MPQQGQYSIRDIDPAAQTIRFTAADVDAPGSFAADLTAVRGKKPNSFDADLAAVRAAPHLSTDPNAGEPIQFSAADIDLPPSTLDRLLGLLSKAAHIPGVTVAPESVRQAARKAGDAITTPTRDDFEVPTPFGTFNASTIKGFGAGAIQGGAEFANLLDLLSLGRRSSAVRGANALLAVRGVGNVAEGVNEGSVAHSARGVAEAALGTAGLRGATRSLTAADKAAIDEVVARIRGAGTPAASTTTANAPATVEQTVDLLRRATAPPAPVSRGFAEPPVPVRTAVPSPVPRTVVEAVAARPALTPKPHYTAADVVEHLRQLEQAKATSTAAPAADVVLDSRIAAPPAGDYTSKIASDVIGEGRVPAVPAITEQQYQDLLERLGGRGAGPSPREFTAATEPVAGSAASDAATLQGRASIESLLPPGVRPTAEQMNALDTLGNAYRKADVKVFEAQRAFGRGEVTAEQLQAAQLARRQAGKSLRQSSVRIVKEAAEAAAGTKLRSDAGIIAPDLTQWLASTTGGAVLGASEDEQHPVRGAIVGGIIGASIPGAVSAVRQEGVRGAMKMYVSGLLSGPSTHVRNTAANAANGLLRIITHPAAVGVDTFEALLTGRPRERFLSELDPALVATWTGFKRGLSDALETLRTGRSPYSGAKFNPPPGATSYALPGGLTNPANWPGRALDAADALAGRTIESQVIAQLAVRDVAKRGLKGDRLAREIGRLQANPTPEMLVAARAEAERTLFREGPGQGLLGGIVKVTEDLRKKFPAFTALIPFTRVNTSIYRQLIELTPAGALLRDTPREAASAVGKVLPLVDLPAGLRADRLGRMLTGSVALTYAVPHILEGRVSGAGPSDPNERAHLMETGWRPHSINMPLPDDLGAELGGGRSADGTYRVPASLFGPAGQMLTTVADLVEGWKESGAKDDATKASQVAETVARFAANFADQTIFGDFLELGDALANPSQMERFLNRKVQSGVPFSSLLRTITRTGDPVARDANGPLEAIQQIIPGQSDKLPEGFNRFGETITYPGPTGAGAYFLPAISPTVDNPAKDVLDAAGASLNKSQARIHVNDRDVQDALTRAGFVFGEDGEIKLTPAERRTLQRQRGQQIATILRKLKSDDPEVEGQHFSAYSPAAQRAIIESIKRRVESRRREPEILQLLRSRREQAGQSSR